MSDSYAQYRRDVARWRAGGDADRLALPALFDDGIARHETDPAGSLAVFTRGRDEAARLGEGWWVLFFDAWRLTAHTSYLMNYATALPLAVELLARFESPAARHHPWRTGVLINVVYTHVQMDPVGYRADIERGFAHLDEVIPPGPEDDNRFVVNLRRTYFHMAVEEWAAADDLALRTLALADRSPLSREWFGAWVLLELCRICDARGEVDRLAGHAAHMAEVSAREPRLRRTLAAAWCWRAVAEQLAGNARAARRSLHRGLAALEGVDRRDAICGGAVARYYELSGDLGAALAVRDRELADAEGTGRLHRACQMHVERCRLLGRAGGLRADDLTAARRAAAKLRDPTPFLNALQKLAAPPEGK